MIKTFNKPLDFLLFSNLFIALGALAQGMVTYQLLGYPPSFVVLVFLFFSTLLNYNFSILIQKPKNHQQSKYRRVRWIFRNYRLNVFITMLSFVVLVPLFFLLSSKSQFLLFFLALISIGYAFPMFSIHGKRVGLRSIPGLKLFLIALVWSFSTVMLPVFEIQKDFLVTTSLQDEVILTLKRFLFITAITIPFDIRDMFQDKTFSLRTIPTIFGEKKAYFFCQLMLVSYLVLLFFFRFHGLDADFYALALTTILAGWLIFKSKWEKNEYYYFFYLDGTLILQYVMLLIFNFIL